MTMLELAVRHHHHVHHVDNSGWGAIVVLMVIFAIAGLMTARDKRK